MVSKKGGDSNDKGEVLERKVEDFFRSLNKGPSQADTKAKRPGAEPWQVKREVPREEERPQPYLVTRTTELPPRWYGPAGTVVLIDKPKGDAFPSPLVHCRFWDSHPKVMSFPSTLVYCRFLDSHQNGSSKTTVVF